MMIRIFYCLAVAFSLFTAAVYQADSASTMPLLGVGGTPGGGGGATSFLLQTDAVSRVLQTDAVSKICLAGGC